MPCRWIKFDDGTVAHLNVARPPRRKCPFCRQHWAELLCDGPKGSQTCDRPICHSCAKQIGEDRHLCPDCQGVASKQSALFDQTDELQEAVNKQQLGKALPAKLEFLSTRSILADLRCATCSVCGLFKKSRQSFCSNCYYSLPGWMQNNLHKRMGKGYEEAFRVARMWLLNLRKAAQGLA